MIDFIVLVPTSIDKNVQRAQKKKEREEKSSNRGLANPPIRMLGCVNVETRDGWRGCGSIALVSLFSFLVHSFCVYLSPFLSLYVSRQK